MPYCHDCATEYAELLPWCPNCGAMHDDDLDEWEVDLMTDDELIVAYNAPDEISALLYRTMLEEADIDVIERPMEEPWLEGVMIQGLHSQLLVREEDAERALSLVASFKTEADTGELDAEKAEDKAVDETEDQPKAI